MHEIYLLSHFSSTAIYLVGESVCPVNGDLYFRSMDGNGIRSYRNARAEFAGAGQTPLSTLPRINHVRQAHANAPKLVTLRDSFDFNNGFGHGKREKRRKEESGKLC
jgi:hypothetical protein